MKKIHLLKKNINEKFKTSNIETKKHAELAIRILSRPAHNLFATTSY